MRRTLLATLLVLVANATLGSIPLTITNRIGNLTGVGEILSWRGDERLATHTVVNTNFTDNQAYFYQDMSQRLAEERQNVDASHRWTNVMTFDKAQAGGPGVLTKVTGS